MARRHKKNEKKNRKIGEIGVGRVGIEGGVQTVPSCATSTASFDLQPSDGLSTPPYPLWIAILVLCMILKKGMIYHRMINSIRDPICNVASREKDDAARRSGSHVEHLW